MSITTTQELCLFITLNHPAQIDSSTSALDAAVWFCCIMEAESAFQLNRKEMAGLFLNGIKAYTDDPDASVQQWLDGFNAYINDMIECDEDYETIEQEVNKVFGEE